MSWSDDIRCLYCDGKLPLYRKIASGQFCSAAHRRAYWKQQERLAVERLSQTRESLRADRPEPDEASITAAVDPEPPANPAAKTWLRQHDLDVQEFARTSSNRDQVVQAGFLRPVPPAASDWHSVAILPAALSFLVPRPNGSAIAGIASGCVPATACDVRAAGTVDFARRTAPAESDRTSEVRAAGIIGPIELEGLAEPERTIEFPFALDSPELVLRAPEEIAAELVANVEQNTDQEIAAQEDPAPPMARAVAAAACAASSSPLAPIRMAPVPAEQGIPAPGCTSLAMPERCGKRDASLATAAVDLLPLRAPGASASRPAPVQAGVKTMNDPGASFTTGAAPLGLETPPVPPRFRLANAARYPLTAPRTAPWKESIAPAEPGLLEAAVPESNLAAIAPTQEPGWAWLMRLPVQFREPQSLAPARAAIRGLTAAYPNGVEPKPPASRLAPVNGAAIPAPPRSLLAFANWTPRDPAQSSDPWRLAADFWNQAPRDLKLALFAIPVLVALAMHPGLPKVHVSGPAAAGRGGNFQQVLAKQFDAIQQNVADRAAIALSDDFRSGLEDWQMRGDLSAAWSFDSNGFVRPGSLALYRPSMRLSDYELQFLGLIDKKALSFVARAQDFQNYYVIKLVVLKPGPLPTIGVTRYAVIGGKAQQRFDTVAPITAMTDMLYRVDLVVRGDTYLLSLQGKVADSWTEAQLTRGGIGFFSARGEESRVRWVQLTHQYDMLGRLCAYLAPYNIPTTNGSW